MDFLLGFVVGFTSTILLYEKIKPHIRNPKIKEVIDAAMGTETKK